jgi:hypothetical protein
MLSLPQKIFWRAAPKARSHSLVGAITHSYALLVKFNRFYIQFFMLPVSILTFGPMDPLAIGMEAFIYLSPPGSSF